MQRKRRAVMLAAPGRRSPIAAVDDAPPQAVEWCAASHAQGARRSASLMNQPDWSCVPAQPTHPEAEIDAGASPPN